MLHEHQGECPFCHAMIFLSLPQPQLSQEELSVEAAQWCTCEDARLHRGMQATEGAIQKTLCDESIKYGFDYAANDDVLIDVREICRMLLLNRITGTVTFSIPGGDNIKLVNNGNTVRIRRTSKKQMEI